MTAPARGGSGGRSSAGTALVTGANSGIGLAVSLDLAGRGWRVLMACRSPERSAPALAEVTAAAGGPPPELVTLDLADLAAVRTAASTLQGSALDLVVNNAGVMALPPMVTADGFELQWGTNHLGHFALDALLFDTLTPTGRVVTVSSIIARRGGLRIDDLQSERGYDPWVAYARSKQANLLFAVELHRRLAAAGDGRASLAAHPGLSATSLIANGPGRFAGIGAKAFYRMWDLLAPSPSSAARAVLLAATDRDARSGDYFGPKGPGQMFGPAGRVRLPASVRDPQLGRRLWEASEELSGVEWNL